MMNGSVYYWCLPRDKFSWSTFILNGLVPIVLVALGICGAMYSLYLLYTNTPNGRFVKYLKFLCGWDIALLLSAFSFQSIYSVLVYGNRVWDGALIIYPFLVFYPIGHIARTGSVWMVLTVTMERYLALSRPFRQRVREAKSVKPIFLSIAIGSVLCNLTMVFEFTWWTCSSPDTGDLTPALMPTSLRLSATYVLVCRVVLNAIVVGPVPFAFIIIFTVKTLLIIHKNDGECGRRRSDSIIRETKIRVVLSAVIVKFLICYSCPVILSTIEYFGNEIMRKPAMVIMADISNLLVLLHSATNWMIFCRWRRNRPKRRNAQRANPHVFNGSELEQLRAVWSQLDKERVGTEMMVSIIKSNPRLISFFQENAEPIEDDDSGIFRDGNVPIISRRSIAQEGRAIGLFIDQVIKSLQHHDETIERVRGVGRIHFYKNVNLDNRDWFMAKHFLVGKLIENSAGCEQVANKFVSFLINELKVGFLCQATLECSNMGSSICL